MYYHKLCVWSLNGFTVIKGATGLAYYLLSPEGNVIAPFKVLSDAVAYYFAEFNLETI